MISIVIPVYNRKELVRRAIRSALSQTHTDFEIIVVDDGSDDGTAQLLEETYGEQDRILILPQATNRGVSASRNLGIGAASGEWIALLDSDDEWRPPKLERQLSALLESELRVCHTNEIWDPQWGQGEPAQTPSETRRQDILRRPAAVRHVPIVDRRSPRRLRLDWPFRTRHCRRVKTTTCSCG